MSNETNPPRARCVDRRGLFRIAVKTTAALTALPMASVVLAGCGGLEEEREPAARDSGSAPVQPRAAPSPPRAASSPPARAAAPPPAAAEGEDRLVSEVPAVASVVSALQYVNDSPKSDQSCANCQLYTAGSGGRGKCQLFQQGLVKETGWCASWVARVS